MSAYSTISITRATALKLYLARMDSITDDELEKFLEYHLDKYLYNVNIVPDHHEFGRFELNGDQIAESLMS